MEVAGVLISIASTASIALILIQNGQTNERCDDFVACAQSHSQSNAVDVPRLPHTHRQHRTITAQHIIMHIGVHPPLMLGSICIYSDLARCTSMRNSEAI